MAIRNPSKAGRAKEAEYHFRIDAFSPETIPMARLAEYLRELAGILGETAHVHFDRLESGSTIAVARIEHEAQPKVRERVVAIGQGLGPRDAQNAYRAVDEMLRSDNATGSLREGRRAGVVLQFPGASAKPQPASVVRQHGSVQGMLIRVGGTDGTVPVQLEVEGRTVTGCWTDRSTAKKLAQHLFDQVRLFGEGCWTRSPDGVWALDKFHVKTFEPLDSGTLGQLVGELRGLGIRLLPDAEATELSRRHDRA